MKHLMFISLLVFFIPQVYSQQHTVPIDETTKLITWKDVVQQNGTKEVLYNRAIEWINSYYSNPQGITKIRDVDNGKILINHAIRLNDTLKSGEVVPSQTTVNYVFNLEFRENRYRYTFSDFTMKANSKFPLERWLDTTHQSYQPAWAGYLLQIDKTINETISSLKEGMKEKVVKEDNW